MIFACALLAGVVAAGWLVPRVLARVDLRRRDPLPLIVAWLVSTAGVLVATASGVLLLLLPKHGPGVTMLAAVHRCWAAVQHGSPPRVEEIAGLVGVASLAAFAVRLVVISVRGVRERGRRRRENLEVLRLVGRPADDVLWLAHEQPLAFSMAGRPGVVVATEGLTRHLEPGAVAAVLAHGRAHLTGRHHVLVAIADAVRASLPFVPLFRAAPKAVRDLVELAADVGAARDCGPAAVHTALLRVTGHGAPSASLAMAQKAVHLRLARLQHGSRPPGTLRRTVACGLTAMTAVVLPFVSGTGFLLGAALLTCPLGTPMP
jgi:beta-lactamase regulating signal transducer with metallopeptidase domain